MEVLNSYVTQDVSWLVVLLAFIVINMVCIYSAISCDIEWYIGLIIGTMVFFVIIGIMFSTGAFQEYTIYEARIDDSISFKDIYDSYEVIDQRGSIYILKELIK